MRVAVEHVDQHGAARARDRVVQQGNRRRLVRRDQGAELGGVASVAAEQKAAQRRAGFGDTGEAAAALE